MEGRVLGGGGITQQPDKEGCLHTTSIKEGRAGGKGGKQGEERRRVIKI